jgi:penicillin-binding protein 1A
VPTFGANSPLVVGGHEVAVKTGTTNNNKDAWIVGYTTSITVGVWAGNNDNKAMRKGGSAVAGPIWNKFMATALAKYPNEKFDKPSPISTTKPILRGVWQGNESYFIDKITGKLATEFTPEQTKEERVITNVKSILYWVDRNDIQGPRPNNIENNRQYINWNTPIQNWWSQNAHNYNSTTINDIPTEYDNIHGNYKPTVSLIEPKPDTVYSSSQAINVLISQNVNLHALIRMDIFINGNLMNSLTPPFNYSFTPKDIINIKDTNEIIIKVYDSVYNTVEINSTFKVGL